MEFRVLGPLEVVDEGRVVDVGGPRPRLLLSRLLVDAGQVVPAERLADDLWPGEDDTRALAALRTVVARTRRALGGRGEPLLTRSPGYVLAVPRADVDAARFEDGVRTARAAATAGDHASALAALDAALGLWRGAAYADSCDHGFARGEAARLEELRRGALEDRVAARLGLGDHVGCAPEAEALIASDPLRERVWALLMVALYRSGRQADALRAYQDLRRTLGDELGIEPSPDLVRLESAILRQDPELDWHEAVADAVSPGAAPSPPVARIRGPADGPASTSVDDVPSDVLRVLEVVATAGTDVDFRVLAAACERSDDELAGILDDALRAGLVEELAGSGLHYRFADEAARAAIYDRLSATRRVLLHRRVGEAIERVHEGRLDEHVADLARHFSLASATGSDRALVYVRELAEVARGRLAHGDAMRLWGEAVDLAAAVAADDHALRADILLGLGEAQRRTGEPAHRSSLLAAADAADAAGDPGRLVGAALALARTSCTATDPDPERLAVLEAAVARSDPADSPSRARLLAALASELVQAGSWERRRQLSDEAVAMARRLDVPEVLADVLERRAAAIAHPTTIDERVALADELRDLCSGLADDRRRGAAELVAAAVTLETGDLVLAAARAEAAGATPHGGVGRAAALARAAVAAARGDITGGGASGARTGGVLHVAHLLAVGVVRGDLGELEDEISALAADTACPVVHAAHAVVLHGAGRREDAARALATLGDLRLLSPDGASTATLCLAAEAAALLDDADVAAAAAEGLRPHRAAFVTTGPVWWGATARWLGRAAAAGHAWDEADALLDEATRAHERAGAPAWVARSLVDRAAVVRARGDVADADTGRGLVARATEIGTGLGLRGLVEEANRISEALLA